MISQPATSNPALATPEARHSLAEVARVVRSRVVVDACQGISAAAWRDAGWRVSSLTGMSHVDLAAAAEAPVLPEL